MTSRCFGSQSLTSPVQPRSNGRCAVADPEFMEAFWARREDGASSSTDSPLFPALERQARVQRPFPSRPHGASTRLLRVCRCLGTSRRPVPPQWVCFPLALLRTSQTRPGAGVLFQRLFLTVPCPPGRAAGPFSVSPDAEHGALTIHPRLEALLLAGLWCTKPFRRSVGHCRLAGFSLSLC